MITEETTHKPKGNEVPEQNRVGGGIVRREHLKQQNNNSTMRYCTKTI